MGYTAKVYKVFIASPSDVANERDVVRSVIARWNAINSENQGIVLLPVGWDTHSAPESGRSAQDYINQDILDKCDILIGIFWSKVGSPTKKYNSGTIEEIYRHIDSGKLAMLYFSLKAYPSNVDTDQLNNLREFKKKYQNESLYDEFSNEYDLNIKLYDHIQIKINEGKFYGSDLLAEITDDHDLSDNAPADVYIRQIGNYIELKKILGIKTNSSDITEFNPVKSLEDYKRFKGYLVEQGLSLTNVDLEFDLVNNFGVPFMISGEAQLSTYYNYGYSGFETSHFCIEISPQKGSQWYIYCKRDVFNDLFNLLKTEDLYLEIVAIIKKKSFSPQTMADAICIWY